MASGNSRTLPYDEAAEKAFLGCLLISPSETVSIASDCGMKPQCFFRVEHQVFYYCACKMLQDGVEPDLITISDWMRSRKVESVPGFERGFNQSGNIYDFIGGVAFVNSLTSNIENTVHCQEWCKIVVDKWRARKLIDVSTKVVMALHEGLNPDGATDLLMGEIASVHDSGTRGRVESANEIVPRAMGELEAIRAGKVPSGLMTGLRAIDRRTNGIEKDSVVYIAARPSCGKTALLGTIASNVSVMSGKPSVIYSLEMSSDSLALRTICALAGVNLIRYKENQVSMQEIQRVSSSAAKLRASPMYIDERPVRTIADISVSARIMAAKMAAQGTPLAMIGIDYLQLIAVDRAGKRETREQQVSNMSRTLKCLAKELSVPIFVLSQLSRDCEKEDRPPRLSDLRESGSLEQDADIVVFIQRKKLEEGQPRSDFTVDLIFGKIRNASPGTSQAIFEEPYCRFVDIR